MHLCCVSCVNLNNKSLSPITSVTLLDASNKIAEACVFLGGKMRIYLQIKILVVCLKIMLSLEYEAISSTSLLCLFSLYNTVAIFVNYSSKCPTTVFLGVYFTLETEINPF